jgi:hypothetical protein
VLKRTFYITSAVDDGDAHEVCFVKLRFSRQQLVRLRKNSEHKKKDSDNKKKIVRIRKNSVEK